MPREALVANRAPNALISRAARGARIVTLILLHVLARHVRVLSFEVNSLDRGGVHLGRVRGRKMVAEDGSELKDLPADMAPVR